jgi:putative membrane protein
MNRSVVRFLPALAAALAAALLGAGSFAFAGDRGGPSGEGGHWGHHHSQRGDHSGRGQGYGHNGGHRRHYSAWDEEWLMMSIEGDRFEIAGGQLAQQKSSSSDVRAFGARLVADHSKSLQDAVEVAEKLGIEVPDSPSPTQQWQLRVVAGFSGSQFDRWYADLEVQDHKQDITEAEDEVEKGHNPKIRQLAADDLPVLREHLALAEALAH